MSASRSAVAAGPSEMSDERLPSSSSTWIDPRPKVSRRWSGSAAKVAAGTLPPRVMKAPGSTTKRPSPRAMKCRMISTFSRGTSLLARPRAPRASSVRGIWRTNGPSSVAQETSQV